MARIGVFVCWCGANIAEHVMVNQLVEAARELPEVVTAVDYKFLCSRPGQDTLAAAIKENDLDGVVIAACSPRMHEHTYRRAVAKAGLNPYLMEMANIREHVSWVTADREAATAKAVDLIRMKVRKVARLRPLEEIRIPVTKRAMVIGGGVAGIQAALDIAEAGHEVILVEKEPSIGGHMAQLDETFPTLDCSQCILTPKMVEVAQHERIKLLSYSEVEAVSGFIGNFRVKVRRKARYIKEEDCTGCGDCVKVCPVRTPNAFDAGLSVRSAIYRPFPQAVPGAFVVDKRGEAPCARACPAGVNVQGYLALAGEGKFTEALALIRRDNPFPAVCGRVCTHPCEAECNRRDQDEPLAIRQVKRFLADYEAAHPPADGEEAFPAVPEADGDRVAVIGAGPAGLTAAISLVQRGYRVTVLERDGEAGGLLRHGIPAFRLPRTVLDREIDLIRRAGVDIQPNRKLGVDFTLDSLEKEGYRAIFVATGAQRSRRLGISGEEAAGVTDAISFLYEAAHGRIDRLTGPVAVVGGGNSALDAARTAVRLGAPSVRILYRRGRAEMPADPAEIDGALAEGINLEEQWQPVRVELVRGRVNGLVGQKTRPGAPDASGRPRPEPVPGSEKCFAADLIINAVGQDRETASIFGPDELQVNEWGMVLGRPGVFAGGDLVLGPASVVGAIAAGRRAAAAIHAFLSGTPLPVKDAKPLAIARLDPKAGKMPRLHPASLDPISRRGGFAEVEDSFTEEQARAEARRCLNCAVCSTCRECEKVCERRCIDHGMADEVLEEEVGAIVVATGYRPFDPTVYNEYGYGRYKDVLTGLEFERLCSSTGPTEGRLRRPSDGRDPETIVFIQCVGSRDDDKGHPYCSKTCCLYTAKHATLAKSRLPESQSYVFYIDIRAAGKGYEEFVRRAGEEYGARYLRGRVSKVLERGGKLIVRGEDTLVGRPVEIEADLVVLAVAMEPQPDAADVARRLGISYDEYAFFTEAHPKLRPNETNTAGIFLAGACQAPRDIPDAVAGGSAAAAKALALLAQPTLVRSPFVSSIDRLRCTGCFTCATVCPFDAVERETQRDGTEKAAVNRAKCQGCGLCAAACRNGAADLEGFSAEQLLEEVENL